MVEKLNFVMSSTRKKKNGHFPDLQIQTLSISKEQGMIIIGSKKVHTIAKASSIMFSNFLPN